MAPPKEDTGLEMALGIGLGIDSKTDVGLKLNSRVEAGLEMDLKEDNGLDIDSKVEDVLEMAPKEDAGLDMTRKVQDDLEISSKADAGFGMTLKKDAANQREEHIVLNLEKSLIDHGLDVMSKHDGSTEK